MVLALQALGLLLQGLDVAVLGLELLLKTANLTQASGFGNTGGVLAAGLLVAFEELDAVFEAEDVKDHDVGAVEDEREEQREATEVHVALRVEFAGLDFHALGTEGGGSAIDR